MDKGFHWSSRLAESCEIAFKAKLINEPLIEYRGMSEAYHRWSVVAI